MPYTLLPDRAVLALEGPDALDLLQGLVTNDVDPVAEGRAVYAALLTPQGKYLCDFFVVAQGDALLLDCPIGRKADLHKRLNLYRLRSEVTIRDPGDALSVLALFGEDAEAALAPAGAAGTIHALDGGLAYVDPRLPAAGLRAIVAAPAPAMAALGIAAAPDGTYEAHRLELMLPDSERDLVVDKSLVLESNLDALNGVDFSKGCFVGQEVTARTRYRGLVRKRLLGVRIDGPVPAPGTPLSFDGKDAGTMRSARHGRGIALLRLEAAQAALDSGVALTAGEAALHPLWPDWLPEPAATEET